MKRPLLPVTLLYVGGILAAELRQLPLTPLLAAGMLLAIAAVFWRRLRGALLCPLILLAGLANSEIHTVVLSPVDLRTLVGREPHLAVLRGKLIETPSLRVYQQDNEPSWRTLARVRVSGLCFAKETWRPASGTIAVTTGGQLTNHFAGEVVEVTGVLAPPRTAVAEGTFDYKKYLFRQGIYYQLSSESENDWRVVDRPPAPPLADRFSAWGRRALELGLPGEDESVRLEWALALGWRTALTEEACEPFVRAATYHIFAVDGLRMAIVFGIFYSVLRALSVPRPICGAVLIPVIWFYVALTGWPASAIRASVMLTVVIAGWVLKRPSNPANSLFAAALIILIWQPQQLFQAGFQLSFFVVLCLILIIPPLHALLKGLVAPDPLLPAQLRRRWHPVLEVPVRFMWDISVTSFAAWIGSLPLVAYYFNIVTPVSTPANVLAVPLCILALISNLLSLLFAAWLPAAAAIFNHAGWFGMECIRVSSVWFARWPAAYWYVSAPSWATILVYYVVLIAVASGWLFRAPLRPWKIAGLCVALTVWSLSVVIQARVTRLTVFPAGGPFAYCDAFGSKRDLMVDVGPSNAVQFITKPFLRAQGVNQLPNLVLTHGDVRHTGGTEPLAESLKILRIRINPVKFRSSVYRRMLGRLGGNADLLKPANLGDVVAGWRVAHPSTGDKFSKADDGALALTANLGRTRILLLSDLGQAGQEVLLRRTRDLRADILVTGLPSTGEPICDQLLTTARPELIIVLDAEFPITERASPRLRARLKRLAIPILYTSETGAVTLTFTEETWRLRTMSGLRLSSNSRLDDYPDSVPKSVEIIQGSVDSAGVEGDDTADR